jgi:ferredoxin
LDRVLEVPHGTNLYRALRKEHVNLHWTLLGKILSCRGAGLCGMCRIRVLSDVEALPARTRREEKRLKGKPADWRLACEIKVERDLRIQPFPLVPLGERVGEDALALARRPPEERLEWIEKDRAARREARRQAAVRKTGVAPGKKGVVARLLGKRRRKEDDETSLETEPAAGEKKKRRFALPGKGQDKPTKAKAKKKNPRLGRKKKAGDDEGA